VSNIITGVSQADTPDITFFLARRPAQNSSEHEPDTAAERTERALVRRLRISDAGLVVTMCGSASYTSLIYFMLSVYANTFGRSSLLCEYVVRSLRRRYELLNSDTLTSGKV
jgi:hypothetical protein